SGREARPQGRDARRRQTPLKTRGGRTWALAGLPLRRGHTRSRAGTAAPGRIIRAEVPWSLVLSGLSRRAWTEPSGSVPGEGETVGQARATDPHREQCE